MRQALKAGCSSHIPCSVSTADRTAKEGEETSAVLLLVLSAAFVWGCSVVSVVSSFGDVIVINVGAIGIGGPVAIEGPVAMLMGSILGMVAIFMVRMVTFREMPGSSFVLCRIFSIVFCPPSHIGIRKHVHTSGLWEGAIGSVVERWVLD